MVFTPVEIIALILIIVTAIKLLFIAANPGSWNKNVAKKVWKNPKRMATVSFVLALIVLYYLVQEISIVQILAAVAFTALLMTVGFAVYSKDLQKMTDKAYKDKGILKKSWFYILIWILLLLWGAKELFF